MAFLHLFTKGTNDFALTTQLTAGQFIGGLPILIIYFILFESNTFYFILNTEVIVAILFNSVMASFLVSFIQISCQKHTTPTNAVLIFSLEPIFASIIAFIAIGEVLSINGYIGAGVMLIAIFVSDTLEVVINRVRDFRLEEMKKWTLLKIGFFEKRPKLE